MTHSLAGTETENFEDTQESMFESAAEFPGHDLVELPHEQIFAGQDEDDHDLDGQELVEFQGEEDPIESGFSTQSESESGIETAAAPYYPNPDPNPEPDPAPEPNPLPDPEPHPDEPNLPLTISDFTALEDRVLKAVSLVRSERQARISAEEWANFQEGRALAAEARATALDTEVQQLKADAPVLDQLQQEVDSLRQEREQVRQRVERLLGQLDALEL